jgi:hypothetical protein
VTTAFAHPLWDQERSAQNAVPVLRRGASAENENRCREWAAVATYADVCYSGLGSDSFVPIPPMRTI